MSAVASYDISVVTFKKLSRTDSFPVSLLHHSNDHMSVVYCVILACKMYKSRLI